MKGFGKLDFNALKRYTSPQAIKDFDLFLDSLPTTVGYNALIAAGIAWLIAGCSVFFAVMEADKVSTLRAELMKVEALKPPIPVLAYSPVSKSAIEDLQKLVEDVYPGIKFTGGGKEVTISAADTDYFPQFLAAINMLQNGGQNWRVTLNTLCVGMDCTTSKVSARLKVESVRVENPKLEAAEG